MTALAQTHERSLIQATAGLSRVGPFHERQPTLDALLGQIEPRRLAQVLRWLPDADRGALRAYLKTHWAAALPGPLFDDPTSPHLPD